MKNLFTYKNNIASGLKRYGKFLLLAVMFLAFNTQAWAGFYLWGYDTNSPQKGNGNATVVAQEMIPTDNTNTVYKISLDGRKSSDYCFFISTTNSKDFTTAYNQRLIVNTFTGNSYLSLGNYGNFNEKIYHVYSNNNLVITISYLTQTATLDATSTEPTPDPEPDPEPDPSGTTPSIRIGKQPVVSNLTDVAMNFQIADWGCTDVTVVKVYYTTDGTEPTTTSSVWEFNLTPAITNNTNFNLEKTGLSSGNYNIKAVACNTSGCGELSDMASFSIYCEQPDQPALSATNGTICSGANITLQITNYASELTYKVVKGTEDTDVAIDNDGNFTLTQGGTYVVKVKNDCSDFVSSSNIVITENEKPEAPTFYNSNRASCTLQNVSFIIAEGNNVIITMNEGTSTTAPAPVDGNEYEGTTVRARIADDLAIVEELAVDPTKDYTLTCYQYNTASLCYSEPVTFYIPKNLPVVSVSASNITTTTAVATAEAQPGPVPNTAIAELYVQWRQKETSEWSTSPNIVQNPEYTIEYLTEGTTYELQAYAKNNSGCDSNGFGYSEIVEFTTATCPKIEQKTVSGVNTDGKVQATITMADSDPTCIYQLYIGDTPMADTQQNGTGNDLQWTVNETGTYYVYGWFNPEQVEVPTFCANAPTVMESYYELDCVQAPTPNINIDKNTICSNDDIGAIITVTAIEGVTYALYKDGVLVEGKTLTNKQFTGITAAGSYTVVAKETSCNTTSTSQAVSLTVIDAATTVTIAPKTATTNPWVPVNFTVSATNNAPYTLTYKVGNTDVTNQMVVVRRGNNYTLKIPRPDTWNSGNSSNPVASATYTVVAELEIADDVTCGSGSNLTITLEDTLEICE